MFVKILKRLNTVFFWSDLYDMMISRYQLNETFSEKKENIFCCISNDCIFLSYPCILKAKTL